jgi:hypothetical protein
MSLFFFKCLFWGCAGPKKALRFGQTFDIYRSNPPGTPLAVVEEKPSTIFSLMQQAEDK